MTTKKRLGRGLDALLGAVDQNTGTTKNQKTEATLRKVPIDQLQRGQYQPRFDMRKEALEELANSIKSKAIVKLVPYTNLRLPT